MTKLNKNKLSVKKSDTNVNENKNKLCLKKIPVTILKNEVIVQKQVNPNETPSTSTSTTSEMQDAKKQKIDNEDCRLKDSLTMTTVNIPTKNQFEILEEVMDEDPATDTIPKNLTRNPTKTKNTKKPPAIVLHNNKILKHKDFMEITEKHAKNGFYVKNSKNNTNVYIRDEDEYKNYMEVLEKQNIPFHTYTIKSEKVHSFIVKGIDSEPDIEEIKKDLENYQIPVKSVYKLNTTRNVYAIHTNNTVYLRDLRKKVRYLCYTKITWDRLKNQNSWIQCRRCQKLDHATSNCRGIPKCAKCGEQHITRECKTVLKEDPNTHTNIKCANCQGPHLSFSKECPIIIKKQEVAKSKQINARSRITKYVNAPIPTVNPWAKHQATENGHIPKTSVNNLVPNSALIEKSENSATNSAIMNKSSVNSANPQLIFKELVSEFSTLNQTVDLLKMLNLVRELNSELKNCSNEMEQFMTINTFCQTKFMANNSSQRTWP